jgi:hypothetical protein
MFFFWFRNILLAFIISGCLSIYITDIFKNFERSRINSLHKQLIGFLEYIIIMMRAGKTIRHIFQESWVKFKVPLRSYLREVGERLEIDPDLE